MPLLGRDKTTERLEQLESMIESEWRPSAEQIKLDEEAAKVGKSARDQVREQLDNMLSNQGFAGNIRAQLRKADLKLTVPEYLGLHLAAAGGLALVGVLFGNFAFAGIGAVGGLFIPRIYVGIRQNQRRNQFNNQLGDVLNLWVNSLRAGYSVVQAMEAVAREAPAPASVEFKRVVSEIAIGIPVETALANMLSRVESEDLDLVFTAVNIQREVGGNLAEILDTISETIRERVKIKGEIKTLTASGRATGTLIGLLPVILAVFLLFINPTYMGQLFFGPDRGGAYLPGLPIPCGWPMIAIALTMMGVGLAVINRIVDIEI